MHLSANIPSFRHDLHKIVGQVASGQVETQDGVGEGVTLVDGDGVRDTISDVEDHTGGTTRGVQGEHSLDAHVAVEGEGEKCHEKCHRSNSSDSVKGR